MRMRIRIITAIAVLYLLSLPLHAQMIRVGSCKVDLGAWELPSCAIETKGEELFILKELVKPLGEGRWTQVGDSQVAWTALSTGFSYFDRSGRIVVTHVAPFDNGPSPFHEGLVRIVQNDKWGLADAKGKLIVPREYDGILEFEGGSWLACIHCTIETMGEYHRFTGGAWVAIDRFGKVIGPVKDPTHK
jgi:hypothetical protein